jgi:transcriptional regulator with XRE-family HTH domain
VAYFGLDSHAVLSGQDLREAREARRLSQEQLAARLGIAARTVRRWENDETPIPRRMITHLKRELGLLPAEEPTLSEASNAELLAEIARRFEHAVHQSRARPRVDRLGVEEGPVPNEVWRDPHLITGALRNDEEPPEERQSASGG